MLLNLIKLILVSINLIVINALAQHEVPGIKFIAEKVVIVDDYMVDDGSAQDNDSASSLNTCMQYPSMVHTCPSFQAALEILENNTIINITTDVVLLQSIVHLNQLNNIVIVGQNMTTVECNDSGVLNCSSCSNVTIRGITWNKCGTYMEISNSDFDPVFTYHYPGITFSKCSNIFIQHCIFQNSTSSAVYLSEVSGVISFDCVQFLFNGPRNFTKSMVNNLRNVATGLTIMQPVSIQAIIRLNISITRCTFSHNTLAVDTLGYSSILLINCNSVSTSLNIYVNKITFISNGILFSPQTYGLGTTANIVSIKILQYLDVASIILSHITFESNRVQLSDPSSVLELLIMPKSFTKMYIQMTSCDFINNAAFNVARFQTQMNFATFSDNAEIHDQDSSYDIKQYSTDVSLNRTDIDIINVIDGCIFRQNVASESVLYLNNNYNADIYHDQFTIMNSTFENNSETVIYVINQHVTFKEMIQFRYNIAEYGAGIYLDVGSSISFDENCDVTFTSNFARKYGGAIFYDAFSSTCENTYMSIQVNNNSAVNFDSNGASIAGNSIYFSIPHSCNISSLIDVVTGFNFSETSGQLVTSPNKLVLYSPAALISSTTFVTIYKVSGVMLGQAINIPACVLDYENNSAGKVLFQVTRIDLNQNYSLIAPNFISISCESHICSNMHIIGGPVKAGDNSSVSVQFTSTYNSAMDWKPIRVILIIELSPCHSGYFYDDELKQCVCYETDNIVSCLDGNATIMKGYWFGVVTDKPTVIHCPINYCEYKNCETTTGICTLPPSLDEQCMPHRTGPACGNCAEGYTLSFDSVECINTNKCTIGITIIVVIITLIYWAVIVVIVFAIMHFQVNIGYLYAITYFYSMLDILFEQTLHPSNHAFLYRLVAVMSGVVKLTPRFMGELCFVEGLSGIDQQIMHYIHPLAIWLVIVMITILARFSPRMSVFLSRGIIRAICLLILLSFTSGASSTTLMIMRGFSYSNIDALYIYVSPDIMYFQGRHLFYSIIAYLFVMLIVVGLPVVLLSEPFLNRKINFVKFKPLLDQFQGCYKDRLRWFASYYMICRQVILNIVVIGYDRYIPLNLLLVTFIIISLIHWLVRPYANKALNICDGLVLQTMILIIAIQIIYFDNFNSVVPLAATFVLVMLPLIIFLLVVVVLNKEYIKNLCIPCLVALKLIKAKKRCHKQTVTVREEYDVTVDHELRKGLTTVVYVVIV